LSLEQEFGLRSERGTMVVSEAEIERMARDLIAQWGRRAAHVAIEGLNKSIDLKDWSSRDMWVRVVRAIHENQGSGRRQVSELTRFGKIIKSIVVEVL